MSALEISMNFQSFQIDSQGKDIKFYNIKVSSHYFFAGLKVKIMNLRIHKIKESKVHVTQQ